MKSRCLSIIYLLLYRCRNLKEYIVPDMKAFKPWTAIHISVFTFVHIIITLRKIVCVLFMRKSWNQLHQYRNGLTSKCSTNGFKCYFIIVIIVKWCLNKVMISSMSFVDNSSINDGKWYFVLDEKCFIWHISFNFRFLMSWRQTSVVCIR